MKKPWIFLVFLAMAFLFGGRAHADFIDGLVAHYPFEGDVNDASGNGNDGTEHGDLECVEGVIGQALSFDAE